MINKLMKYKREDSLIRDNFVLFTAIMFGNVAAFFYHFYMGRVLGPEDYGILGVVLSLLYIINVPFNVIQTTITNIISEFKAKNQEKQISLIYRTTISKFFFYGILITLIFFVISPIIANFLKIPLTILFVFSPIFIFALILPVTRGYLQGQQSFKKLGFNVFIEAFTKLTFGILLVYLGFHIYGAVTAIVISFGAAFIYLYITNKNIPKSNEKYDMKKVYKQCLPILIALLLLTFYYTIDMFLVKHYFSDLDAGYYAALSVLGKIVFFASVSVSTVMFPKVADLHARNKTTKYLMYKSMFLVFLIGFFIILFYFLFPKLVITTLFGSAYLSISSFVWLFGLIMLLFSLSYLLVLYNLSVSRRSFLWILITFAILESVIILIYHPSLMIIINELVLLNFLSFILMLIYTLRKNGTVNNNSGL
ncbi:MAG: oligosaccharide flippase family protein [archaeon]